MGTSSLSSTYKIPVNAKVNEVNSEAEAKPENSDTSKEETTMSTDVIDVTPEASESKDGAIQLHNQPSLSSWNRPIMPSEMEVVGTIQSSGVRPIAASHLEVFGTLMGGRPIESNHLKIAEMIGDSPIFYSEIKMLDGNDGLFGRPVMASNPDLMNADTVLGSRPIASNAIDDAPALMGFLD